MDNTTKYDWVDFYKELSGRLLQYKSNHQGLVEVVKRIYETASQLNSVVEQFIGVSV